MKYYQKIKAVLDGTNMVNVKEWTKISTSLCVVAKLNQNQGII